MGKIILSREEILGLKSNKQKLAECKSKEIFDKLSGVVVDFWFWRYLRKVGHRSITSDVSKADLAIEQRIGLSNSLSP